MQMHSSTQQDLMCRQGKIKVTRPGFNDNQQDLAHGKLAGRKEMECFIWSTSQAKPAKVQICDNLSAPMRGYLASSRSTSGYVLKKIADIRHEFTLTLSICLHNPPILAGWTCMPCYFPWICSPAHLQVSMTTLTSITVSFICCNK